jgi:enamine deaminase RidA (YjgF/YER057c/UK114 family)
VTVCVAGQLPLDAEGRLAAQAFADQADLVFSKLQSALASAGALPSHLIEIRSYLTSADDLPAFRAARERWFATWGLATPPAATTLVVQALVGGAAIELDARAVAPPGT